MLYSCVSRRVLSINVYIMSVTKLINAIFKKLRRLRRAIKKARPEASHILRGSRQGGQAPLYPFSLRLDQGRCPWTPSAGSMRGTRGSPCTPSGLRRPTGRNEVACNTRGNFVNRFFPVIHERTPHKGGSSVDFEMNLFPKLKVP